MRRPLHPGLVILTAALALSTLACASSSAVVAHAPRWACPSPMPLPYGPDGPVKAIEQVPIGTATPTGAMVYEERSTYFEQWEREYGALGGPPFPSPTPYAMVGTSYTFGQRVELWPLHVELTARAGAIVQTPGVAPGTQQLYLIDLAWTSRAADPIPFDYRRVQLRAITEPSGALVSDQRWGVTSESLRLTGIDELPETIPSGSSRVTVPVIAPPGTPEVVDVTFVADPAFSPAILPATDATETPESAMPTDVPSPTPRPALTNPELRAASENTITVQWADAIWRAPGAAPCGSAGALTDWSAGGDAAWGMPVPVAGVAAPPGSERLIQLALAQVGKRYVWGAKGPERFDCSGLVAWAYAQIGIRIPQGTAGQWPGMTAVTASDARPGDLVFFDIAGTGRIDHVAMLVGDLDGDGQMDIVHAASPELGVRIDYGVFRSAYYAPRIRGFRTARG